MIVVAVISFFLFTFLYLRDVTKRNKINRSMRLAMKVFNQIYNEFGGYQIAKNERKRLDIHDDSFIYGEIRFAAFAYLLDNIEIKPGEVFYDLGCGSGKAVIAAGLLRSWRKCCGIEFLPGLAECCHEVKKKVLANPGFIYHFKTDLSAIEFKNQNFLEADFLDADVVFLHATTFQTSLWQALLLKLNQLKVGSRVIVASLRLPEAFFELKNAHVVTMGWGECSVYLYHKK